MLNYATYSLRYNCHYWYYCSPDLIYCLGQEKKDAQFHSIWSETSIFYISNSASRILQLLLHPRSVLFRWMHSSVVCCFSPRWGNSSPWPMCPNIARSLKHVCKCSFGSGFHPSTAPFGALQGERLEQDWTSRNNQNIAAAFSWPVLPLSDLLGNAAINWLLLT